MNLFKSGTSPFPVCITESTRYTSQCWSMQLEGHSAIKCIIQMICFMKIWRSSIWKVCFSDFVHALPSLNPEQLIPACQGRTSSLLFMSKPSWTPEVSLEEEQTFDWVKGWTPSRASENVQSPEKPWQQLHAHHKCTDQRRGRKWRWKRHTSHTSD